MWPNIGTQVTQLYNRCLEVGFHPDVWKEAKIVFILKPNKKNYSLHKAFKPISLLLCLIKGLERLQARQIARAALFHKTLPSLYFRALLQRSAGDLAIYLIHRLEQILDQGL